MRYCRLEDLRNAVCGINENPSIWIMDEFEEDTGKSFSPTEIIVDDDGDIILKVSTDLLNRK